VFFAIEIGVHFSIMNNLCCIFNDLCGTSFERCMWGNICSLFKCTPINWRFINSW